MVLLEWCATPRSWSGAHSAVRTTPEARSCSYLDSATSARRRGARGREGGGGEVGRCEGEGGGWGLGGGEEGR